MRCVLYSLSNVRVLLRVELDDEMVLNLKVYIIPGRQCDDLTLKGILLALKPLRSSNETIFFFQCLEPCVAAAFITHGNDIAYFNKIRRDIDALAAAGCELLISAGYYYRIPVDSRLPMLNIHPSLLPYGRGAWPMPLAILDRLSESGVTIHKTEESFDTGDILLQTRFDLADDETLESFMRKVNSRLPEMMDALTADFSALWENARPQGTGSGSG